jgi:iron-sulfur cluster repair protein YtfE (RIC family)
MRNINLCAAGITVERIVSMTAFTRNMKTGSELDGRATVSAAITTHFDGREMAMVHRMFRREFMLASGVVRHVAAGDWERASTVAAHLRLVGSILHHHHSAEDRYVWPLLEQRAPSQISECVLRVVEQHRRVDTVWSEVSRELPVWSCISTAESRDRLADALERLADALIEHMDYEERYIVPVMETHISMSEWNEIVQTLIAGLTPEEALLGLGMSMYESEPDLIEQIIAHMPREARQGIRCSAALAYADHAQLIHGTATPPRSKEIRR